MSDPRPSEPSAGPPGARGSGATGPLGQGDGSASGAPDGETCAGLGPGSRVEGEVRVPTSKSIAQRLLVAAALAGGRTRLTALPDGEDVEHLLGALAGWGVELRRPAPRAVTVEGRPPGPGRGPRGLAAVGESGTAARLLTAAGALCGMAGSTLELVGSGSLARRGSPALLAALRGAGAGVHAAPGERWPVRLEPVGPPPEVVLRDPSSSQEVSALLLALAAWPGEHLLRVVGPVPSRPYVELTRAALRTFGVAVEELEAGPGEWLLDVRGPLAPPADPLRVEPDASAAAVALAAGCLGGGEVRVSGIPADSAQGDVAIVRHLAALGCAAGRDARGLWAAGAPTRGARIDLEDCPDLAPVLAAVAAAAALSGAGATELTGLGTLPGKESSRIEVLARGLDAAGLRVEAGTDRLAIAPGTPRPGVLVLDPAGDHRMAFAFALLGLVREGTWVRTPGCVAKSWPTFWRDLHAAGAKVPGLAPPPGYAPRP